MKVCIFRFQWRKRFNKLSSTRNNQGDVLEASTRPTRESIFIKALRFHSNRGNQVNRNQHFWTRMFDILWRWPFSLTHLYTCVFMVLFHRCHTHAENKTKLTLAGVISLNTTSGWSSGGIIPAVELALDDVNNRSDVLQDYELTLDWEDDKCIPGLASHLLAQHVYNGTQKIMVLGSGCSIATVYVASFSHYSNLIQVSYSAASPELSDTSSYPLFFRTQQSDLAHNTVRIAIMNRFNWKRVAALYQNEKFFVQVIDQLIQKMRRHDISSLVSLPFDYQPSDDLRIVKENDGRIIVVHSYEDHARALFCAAYRLGMYGSEYAWMIPGWYATEWWSVPDDRINCTENEMRTVLESVIATVQVGSDNSSNQTTINGETIGQYEARYLHRLQTHPKYKHLVYHDWHGLGYDAIWAMALTLNSSLEEVSRSNVTDTDGSVRGKRLDDFNYSDDQMANIFKTHFANISFAGVSGQVWFNEYQDRIGKMAIYQIRDGQRGVTLVSAIPKEI
ncbi:gamma-aminobutyric acid type B receptor subunit 1-like isoform X1 [Ptychodera flava]|uniref:gamma-aminobutyric acid type B receptor subunit 1-like isoform X1 n=1 Tax=Ptychodera flava TaxID=63121 RepID=UPI00396A78B2